MPSFPSAPAFPAAGSPTFSGKAHRDFALVARILSSHNEQAYAQLVRVYQKPIYQLVTRMVPQRDVAEDLTLVCSISAFKGYTARGGALEAGAASTATVTYSIIAILLADLALAGLYCCKPAGLFPILHYF